MISEDKSNKHYQVDMNKSSGLFPCYPGLAQGLWPGVMLSTHAVVTSELCQMKIEN